MSTFKQWYSGGMTAEEPPGDVPHSNVCMCAFWYSCGTDDHNIRTVLDSVIVAWSVALHVRQRLGGQGPSPLAAKDRLMDNALQSSMSSAQASPMSGTGPARSRRSSSLVSQTMASQTQQPPSAAASSRPASTGSGGVRPAMRRQSAVSDTSADATSMGGLSPVAEQTSTGIIE